MSILLRFLGKYSDVEEFITTTYLIGAVSLINLSLYQRVLNQTYHVALWSLLVIFANGDVPYVMLITTIISNRKHNAKQYQRTLAIKNNECRRNFI